MRASTSRRQLPAPTLVMLVTLETAPLMYPPTLVMLVMLQTAPLMYPVLPTDTGDVSDAGNSSSDVPTDTGDVSDAGNSSSDVPTDTCDVSDAENSSSDVPTDTGDVSDAGNSSSDVPSLLSHLRAPLQSVLIRKQKIRANLPQPHTSVKRKKPACLYNNIILMNIVGKIMSIINTQLKHNGDIL